MKFHFFSIVTCIKCSAYDLSVLRNFSSFPQTCSSYSAPWLCRQPNRPPSCWSQKPGSNLYTSFLSPSLNTPGGPVISPLRQLLNLPISTATALDQAPSSVLYPCRSLPTDFQLPLGPHPIPPSSASWSPNNASLMRCAPTPKCPSAASPAASEIQISLLKLPHRLPWPSPC